MVESALLVQRHAPGLMPQVHDHGDLDGGRLRYLVEQWQPGLPVRTADALAPHLPTIIDQLGRLVRGYGRQYAALSSWAPRGLAQGWAEFGRLGILAEPQHGDLTRLIEQDKDLLTSWCHGHLVASNVLVDSDGVTLLSWGRAGVMPVARDLATLHAASTFPRAAEHLVVKALARWSPRVATLYSPVEQLALAHATALSAFPAQRRAVGGGAALADLERQVHARAARLEALMRAETAGVTPQQVSRAGG